MDSTENRSIKNGQRNGRPSSWRRLCGDGCSSRAAATINLTLHCVKLLLPSTGRADTLHEMQEPAFACETFAPWLFGHSALVVAQPIEHFPFPLQKCCYRGLCSATTASGSRNPCSATARVNMDRENGSGGDGGTSIAAPLPKIKMRFNS